MAIEPKQEKFIDEYMCDLNGTQAAIRAGYSVKTAKEQAARLLSKANIKEEIEKRRAKDAKRLGITKERVLNELAKIAFANSTDLMNYDDAKVKKGSKRHDTAAIQSIKVKTIVTGETLITEREVKLYDKQKALDSLGKHLNLFEGEKVGEQAPVININVPDRRL